MVERVAGPDLQRGGHRFVGPWRRDRVVGDPEPYPTVAATDGRLFLIITLSVIGQVGSSSRQVSGCSEWRPLHHHFEIKGWGEITIVVRFWIVQALFVAAALSLFYAEWVRLRTDVPGLPAPGTADWSGLRVVVAGIGIAGFSCADALLERNADVVVIDDQDGGAAQQGSDPLRSSVPPCDWGRPDPAGGGSWSYPRACHPVPR